MRRRGSLWTGVPLLPLFGAATAAIIGIAAPAEAQRELAIKGAVTFSRFQIGGTDPTQFDDRLVATGFGGHLRFRMGPVLLQPELFLVTRGARASQPILSLEEEQVRLEYIEIPLLLAVPVRLGRFEPYAFGGPMLALESRCRYVTREQGLRTNVGCGPQMGQGDPIAFRRAIDYGLIAGGGLSHPLANGRVLVEARHTWGQRDIVKPPADTEVRHRTFMLVLGYSIPLDADGR